MGGRVGGVVACLVIVNPGPVFREEEFQVSTFEKFSGGWWGGGGAGLFDYSLNTGPFL